MKLLTRCEHSSYLSLVKAEYINIEWKQHNDKSVITRRGKNMKVDA